MSGGSKKLPVTSSRGGAGSKVKQVYLIQPPISGGRGDVNPPLGLLALAPLLEQDGVQVHVIDVNLLLKLGKLDKTRSLRGQFAKLLPKKSEQVDLIGFTSWSYNFDVTMELVEEAKKRHKQAPVVVGGPHTTFVDREAMQAFPAIDFVIRDEGDLTFARLVHALGQGGERRDLEQVPGLTWRHANELVRNPSGGVVEDLDALPYPAYHLIDSREYLDCNPVLVIEAGRGCPYNCNFCSTTNMFQRKYRVKSAPRLVDELEWVIKETGTTRFELLHDNLVAGRKYVRSLCQEIRQRNLDVDWSCTSRTDNITEEIAEEMFLAGCVQVFFGIETLAAERQAWTGKKLKPPKIHEAIELTARQHILPTAGIIVGFPAETQEELDVTLRAALHWTTDPKIKADVSSAVLRYYPGADLFQAKDELRYDSLAAAHNAALPGKKLPQKWQHLTSLFPLQAIHTPPEETRRNIVRVQMIRTLMRAAPYTFQALVEPLGKSPRDVLDDLAGRQREFAFLADPSDTDGMWNEVLRLVGQLAADLGDERVLELLRVEAPFHATQAVAPPLEQLEHVVHPKRYVHDELQAWARGQNPDPGRYRRPHHVLAVRAGKEVFVAVTDDPETLWQRLQAQAFRPPQQQQAAERWVAAAGS